MPEVRDFGAVIYDDAPIARSRKASTFRGTSGRAQLPYGLPMREMSERTTSAAKSRNMVALGYLAGLYGMPRAAFHDTIGGKFKGKAAAITEGNIRAFDAGYEEGEATFKLDFIELGPAPKSSGDAVMMNGNQAIVEAAWKPAWRPSSAIRSRQRPRSSRCWRRACPSRAAGCSRPRTRSRRSPLRSARATPACARRPRPRDRVSL